MSKLNTEEMLTRLGGCGYRLWPCKGGFRVFCGGFPESGLITGWLKRSKFEIMAIIKRQEEDLAQSKQNIWEEMAEF